MQPYFLRIGGGSSSVNVDSFVLGGYNASGQLGGGGSGSMQAAGEDVFAETDDWL